jgi:hypothetical protein
MARICYNKVLTGVFLRQLTIVLIFIAFSLHAQKITLRWQEVKDAKIYQLQVASSKTFSEKHQMVNENTNKLNYDLTVTPGTYYYRLRSIDEAERPGLWSTVNSFEVRLNPPKILGPPDNRLLKARGAKNRSQRFTWQKFDGAKHYILLFDNKKIKVTGTSHKINGIKDGSHSWKVKTITKNNEHSSYSKPRKLVVKAKAAPTAPVLVEPVNNNVVQTSDVNFKWEGVQGATKYNVYIKLISQADDEEDKRFKFVVSKLAHTFPLANGKYEWMVISRDKLGRGGYSKPGFFKVDIPGD